MDCLDSILMVLHTMKSLKYNSVVYSHFSVLVVLIPLYFYFELFVVMPTVIGSLFWRIFHSACVGYISLNIVGNAICCLNNNSTLAGRWVEWSGEDGWSLCAECETLRPPRARHCPTCRICILKRDHHCTFLTCCIGYFNFRYFFFFTFYIFVGMVHAFIFNVQFMLERVQWSGEWLDIFRFIMPIVTLLFTEKSCANLCIFLSVLNVIIILYTGILLVEHGTNMIYGRTTGEKGPHTIKSNYDCGFVENCKEVFGTRWLVVWLSPFIKSPLPGNGIKWKTKIK